MGLRPRRSPRNECLHHLYECAVLDSFDGIDYVVAGGVPVTDDGVTLHDDLTDTFSTDSAVVGSEQFRGLSLEDAETAYVGLRRSEDGNHSFSSGTKHERARRAYRSILDHCREARRSFDSPLVALQTLVFDPSEYRRETGEKPCPATARSAVVDGAHSAVAAVRRRLDGSAWAYAGAVDIDHESVPHVHVVWIGSSDTLDTLDLRGGVERYVETTTGAVGDDHDSPAVRVDRRPSDTVKPVGDDETYGAVHPSVRYVATKLPHLSETESLSSRDVRRGTLAVASRGNAWLRSNPSTSRRDSAGRVPEVS